MNKTIILVALFALLAGGVGGYALSEISDGSSRHYQIGMGGEQGKRLDDPRSDSTMRHEMGGHGMHTDMMVASEREFIEHMIPHHEEAITTANEVLARGATTAEMRTLAEGIVAAQTKEVADMKAWYQTWYGTSYTDNGSYTPMMRELENLSGAELDKAFLEDMIHHHMGAIMMARSVEPHIEHEEIRTLAENIIKTQSDEISQMQTLRKNLQ